MLCKCFGELIQAVTAPRSTSRWPSAMFSAAGSLTPLALTRVPKLSPIPDQMFHPVGIGHALGLVSAAALAAGSTLSGGSPFLARKRVDERQRGSGLVVGRRVGDMGGWRGATRDDGSQGKAGETQCVTSRKK